MPKQTILVVDDERLIRWSVKQKLEHWGYHVSEAEDASTALARVQIDNPDLVTLDIRLPDMSGLDVLRDIKQRNPKLPVIMITAYGAVDLAVDALRLGAFDFVEKPINFEKFQNSVKNALEANWLRTELERSVDAGKSRFSLENVAGKSCAMQEIRKLAQKVAISEATTLLILGESGSGKDLFARAIHYESNRRDKPFFAMNCAAVPETLLETELFGHEKGAFTDAKAMKKGIFELADGGTVFLDEISEMKYLLQAKILRVLEDQTFRRVGGIKDITVNVRIVAASNRNLEDAVREGDFREDLYYRLSVIPIHIPPLREHAEDIAVLIDFFINHYNQKFKKNVKGITREALALMKSYHWPGNVRELKNAIERAMILEDNDSIDVPHLPIRVSEPQSSLKKMETSKNGLDFRMPKTGISLEYVEKELIRQALQYAGGNKTKAARLLEITRDTLRYKVKKYSLS
jgi:DNA-binding NtrC family response regulator